MTRQEVLKMLLSDITQVEMWWYTTREKLIEQGIISEDSAHEPDWAPWDEEDAVREKLAQTLQYERRF